MRKYFVHIGLASLCVCASVSAQEQETVPVALAPQAEYSVATNPFRQNWEVSLGIQGLSFYSNQEAALELSKSPFGSFRTQLGISLSATKWFSPEIGLRTKASGLWGRSVSTDNKDLNAVKYMAIHEDVMVNVSNIIYDYDENRKWDVIPYGGLGMVRNFTHNENAMMFSLGLTGTYRINSRLKAFCDLSFNVTGDDFDNNTYISNNVFASHDRWIAAEVGVTLELGYNRWRRVAEMGGIEIVPWEETQREMKRIRRQNRDLRDKINWLDSQKESEKDATVAPTIISNVPEISIFFELGSSELNHRGQLENIKELVQTAKNENRTVVVTGYADSSTGNSQLNEKLSARRADTIVKELLEMGIDMQKIKIVIGGGVNILNQVPANRRVVVSLGE